MQAGAGLGMSSFRKPSGGGGGLSANANLTSLTISAGTLSPSFASGTTTYTVSEANSQTSVTVTPTRSESHATVQYRVNGGGYTLGTSGTASSALTLNVGANPIDVLVTAQDGSTKTYTITATRAASSDATLSAMTLASGTLSPTFNAGTLSYTASITNGTTTDTVTPTANEGTATIQVRANGGSYVAVTSGQASGTLSMNVGSNTIDVLVTAGDGVTTKTYTTTVTRAASFAVTQSISFDGTNSYVKTVSNQTGQDLDGGQNASISAWIKTTGTYAGANDYTFVDKSFVTRPGYWMAAGGTANKIGTWWLQDSGHYQAYNTSVNMYDGAWHHIVMTFASGGTIKIYVDGSEDTSKTVLAGNSPGTFGHNTTALTIGCRDAATPAGFITAKICHVSIWSIALNLSQIGELRNSGHPADLSQASMFNTTNCKGWYYLGDSDATGSGNVLDHSGNGYHATMNGNAAIVNDAP